MKKDEKKKETWYEYVWSVEGFKEVSYVVTMLSYTIFLAITDYPFSWGWFFFYLFVFPHTTNDELWRIKDQLTTNNSDEKPYTLLEYLNDKLPKEIRVTFPLFYIMYVLIFDAPFRIGWFIFWCSIEHVFWRVPKKPRVP